MARVREFKLEAIRQLESGQLSGAELARRALLADTHVVSPSARQISAGRGRRWRRRLRTVLEAHPDLLPPP